MLIAVSSFVFVALILVMFTLGSVLLVSFFMNAASRGTRVFVAAMAGPTGLLIPTFFISGGGEQPHLLEFGIAVVVIGAIASVIIGWPVAYLATKRLDRMTQFDVGTFE
ncbi:MAG: hypothetical protein AAF687_05980 [Pseudomonadota bacterium]